MLVFYFIYLVSIEVSATDTNGASQMSNAIDADPPEEASLVGQALASLSNVRDEVMKSALALIQNASLHTSFLFFPSKYGSDYLRIRVGDGRILLKAGFDIHKKTKILIHGWTRNGTDPFTTEVRQALHKKEDMNIFSVDWPVLSQSLYPVAYTAVPYIGNRTAAFVDFLVQDVGVELSSIHLIGFSLGAHVAGTAGEGVVSGKLSRITGLDPAGPFFVREIKGRLDPSDAKFVDVIHTAAGTVGYKAPCGTVDFYPNGGSIPQPGCDFANLSCSHGRSYEFFAESVNSDGFIARECSDWNSFLRGECSKSNSAVLGYNVDTRTKGVFFLSTNSKRPFATDRFLSKVLKFID